ncbi:MAG: DMT family transporter [Rhodobacteraceae bacterium]|nr:DMT family transporter [Paracoccaceae bacterium]
MRLLLLTTLAMIAFAGNSVLTRMAVGPGLIDPFTFALLRVIAGAGVLGLLLARRQDGGWPSLRRRKAAVCGLLVYLIGFSWAYGGLAAGPGALILFGMVQITMFAGALAKAETVPPQRWVGAAVAFAGLMVLLLPLSGPLAGPLSGPQAPGTGLWPVVAMAAAGIGWGIYSLVGSGTGDPLGATAVQFLLAVPGMALAWWLFAGDQVSGQGVALALLSGAVTSGLGYVLWYAVLPQLGASRAAVAQLTVPVIAAVGGLVWLQETISLQQVLAGGLVLGGVALASRRHNALPKR